MDTAPPDVELMAFLYASLPTVAPERVILDIIRASERVNALHRVSGMLFYSPARYAQLIEGPAPGVRHVQRKIEADPRHRILWQSTRPLDRRTIGAGLPMGYVSEAEFAPHMPAAEPALDSCTRPGAPDLQALAESLSTAAHAKYPQAADVA